jgi:hypothetical protein
VALGQNDRLAIRKKKVCNISNAADKCTWRGELACTVNSKQQQKWDGWDRYKKLFHTWHLALRTASEGIVHKWRQFSMRLMKTKNSDDNIVESERTLSMTLLPFSKLKLKHLLNNQIRITQRTSRTEVWCPSALSRQYPN